MVKTLDTLNSYNELSQDEMVDTNGGLILLGVATGIFTAKVVVGTKVAIAKKVINKVKGNCNEQGRPPMPPGPTF